MSATKLPSHHSGDREGDWTDAHSFVWCSLGREEEEHELERIDSDKVAPKMEDISSPIPLIIDYDLGCK